MEEAGVLLHPPRKKESPALDSIGLSFISLNTTLRCPQSWDIADAT
jgi:hypothetical protein